MSIDHLPARTAADPHQPEIHLFWDEPNPAGAVLNANNVRKYRDWQQPLADATTSGATAIGAGAAATLAFTPHTAAGYTLAVLAGLLVPVAGVLRWRVAAEGRRWVYATDTTTT